ncbi:MAG: inositol-3-phosphate synthase [Mariniblastus sp.]|nr:inositol-3-phosphate synthase [Mariniblastus sp.]
MSKRVGLWLVGAHGGVSTTVAVGLSALKLQATQNWGLVSELEQFSNLDFIDWSNIVLGGHEIRETDSRTEALLLAGVTPAINRELIIKCESELAEFDKNVRPGVLYNVGETIKKLSDKAFVSEDDSARAAVNRIQVDLEEFATLHQLDQVIVLNLASTEPPVDPESLPKTWAEMEPTLANHDCPLPASSLYAIAALEKGWPFVNFTPSLGSCPSAIDELAVAKKTCHMGHDGKTGETFLKSVLAPAFAQRNLEIMSWVGHNIFGNMDGQVLDDPINKETKVTSKDRLLGQILGYDPQTHISIEYIKSLGDWKTAWDHIHFRGFLGTPMIMTFTWQGCDSILAAPLVLDLFRFTELAARQGETGLLTFLSSFFKSPLGTNENDFSKQFDMLTHWSDTSDAPG